MRIKAAIIANIKNIIAFLHNTGAFVIYLVGQQLILLPYLAGKDEAVYCQAVIFATVLNILGSIIGDDLGNCWLVRAMDYQKKNLSSFPDILRILLTMCVVSAAMLCGASYYLESVWQKLLLPGICCVWLCALRFGLAVYFRKHLKFVYLIWGNLFYCLGMATGLVLFMFQWHWVWIFLFAEIAALLYNLPAFKFCRREMPQLFKGATCEYRKSWLIYIQLSLTSFLLLGALYLDKFILYRLLDTAELTVYFAAAAMSKLIFMLGNPLYSFLLAKLSGSDAASEDRIIRVSQYLSLLMFVVCSLGTAVFMYVGMYLFYNAYLTASLNLFWPFCLASGAGMAIVILRSLVIRFMPKWMLLLNTVIYCIFIFVSGWFLTCEYGKVGMGWAVAAGQFIQSVGLMCILRTRR